VKNWIRPQHRKQSSLLLDAKQTQRATVGQEANPHTGEEAPAGARLELGPDSLESEFDIL
jgi:hypothetical protein